MLPIALVLALMGLGRVARIPKLGPPLIRILNAQRPCRPGTKDVPEAAAPVRTKFSLLQKSAATDGYEALAMDAPRVLSVHDPSATSDQDPSASL